MHVEVISPFLNSIFHSQQKIGAQNIILWIYNIKVIELDAKKNPVAQLFAKTM